MKPTKSTLLLSVFISTPLHVSGNYVPIIRRTYCICATLVSFTVCGWLSGLQRLLSIFISTSVHVSGNCVPIIRRTYCIYATLVFFTLSGWLSGLLLQLLYMFRATVCPSSEELAVSMRHWYFSLCTGGCLVCRPDSHPYRVKNTSVAKIQ